ncbi:MAG TPA: CBS domain-containing protein [Yinghuangia sp.]|uniref:CBS domain-containing protein n=1 Tax=Yinghuangia sp. YIM S10712 TaxID=3436930 RepID=UPI002CDCE82B|nr:CBS domain-containing protein [Yinghuangia sp.]
MTQTVRELMTTEPVTVELRTSATEAARRMRDLGIGDVLVTDDGELRGVLTDRDLVVRGLAEGKDPDKTTVHALCSDEVVTVAPDDAVDHAIYLMSTKALRRLPVVEEGRPIGVVSLGDLAMERDPTSALADISAAEPNQ